MIFFVYYVAALVLVTAELRGLLSSRRFETPNWPAPFWVCIVAGTFLFQVSLCYFVATFGKGPYGVVTFTEGGSPVVLAMLLSAAVQTYAMLGLYRARVNATLVGVAAAVMAFVAIATPVLTNGDLYAYVGNGLLGRGAYAPPSTPFPGELSAINLWWGAPVPPATYGPLWLAIVGGITSVATGLVGKMLALRIANAFTLGLLVALLRVYGVPARILALVALNPALYFQFVLNAHNDLIPATILVAGAAAARARPALAAAAIAAAALIKAPFAIAGLPILVRVDSRVQRYLACAVALISTGILSWLAGGMPYARALMQHAGTSHMENGVHLIAFVAALCAIAAAVVGARRLRAAVWLIPMLGVYTTSWYALWSLPYAIGARRVLTYFLIWLPFVTTLTEPSIGRWWTLTIVVPIVVILSLRPPLARQRVQPGPS